MSYLRSVSSIAILVLCIATSGCLEPDREGYRDQAAEEVCDEADRCDNLGPDGIYDSHADCIIEERSRFNSMWSEEDCGDGKINADDFDRCMSRALDYACDGGLLTGWDAFDRCSASNVCTD